MCSKVLQCLGSNTSFHIWASPRSYAQWHLLQHFLHASHHALLIPDPVKQLFQGVHLQMCGEVLRCLGSNISVHIWTSPRSYAQQHLLQHFLHASHHALLIPDPVKKVFQGVHLQMCGEVLQCLGSDTSVHIWTSPRSYAQRIFYNTSFTHPTTRY